MDRINRIIHEVRSKISNVAQGFDSTVEVLVKFVGVSDEKSYNSIIDSFYLLEDTELTKQEFKS